MDTETEDRDELETRESEVIDIEEREEEENEDVFPYDQELFVAKLREKPRFPAESKECGTSNPKKTYNDWKAPVADRLSIQALTSVDLLKQGVPRPRGCIPPLALPSWHFMPLEKKIPLLQAPKDLFYYTRGKLGEQIHRKTTMFCVRDPYNRERVVFEPYTSLHDPNVKEMLYSPLMRTLLYQRGFINGDDEVLCTLREFNKFRDYLRALYCEQICDELESTDTFLRSEREQLRMLIKSESRVDGKEAVVAARIEAAKKYQEEVIEFKRQKQELKNQMTESRLKQWRNERERRMLEQVIRSVDANRRNKDRLQAMHDRRIQQTREVMTKSTRKCLETQERRENDKAMMQAAYNKFLLEWIESKYVYCYEKMVQKKQMQEDLKESQRYRGRKRQIRLENYREQMPNILAKRKAETERIWAIVRKFAMRWLERVRSRLNAPKDVKHESCWIGQSKNVLDDTVKYLRQESGYEKLDDFILNILKLKKQIQAQIELEEAEEAALEAARLAAEEEEEGQEEGEEDEAIIAENEE